MRIIEFIIATTLLGIIVLAGCAAQQQRDFCAQAQPIFTGPKEKLSDATMRQIAAHNGLGERLCGWSNK